MELTQGGLPGIPLTKKILLPHCKLLHLLQLAMSSLVKYLQARLGAYPQNGVT
jgi:hypothetical protein